MSIKVNVGDTWKNVSDIKINVGDTWKNVTKGYVNVGDVWKQFYPMVDLPTNADFEPTSTWDTGPYTTGSRSSTYEPRTSNLSQYFKRITFSSLSDEYWIKLPFVNHRTFIILGYNPDYTTESGADKNILNDFYIYAYDDNGILIDDNTNNSNNFLRIYSNSSTNCWFRIMPKNSNYLTCWVQLMTNYYTSLDGNSCHMQTRIHRSSQDGSNITGTVSSSALETFMQIPFFNSSYVTNNGGNDRSELNGTLHKNSNTAGSANYYIYGLKSDGTVDYLTTLNVDGTDPDTWITHTVLGNYEMFFVLDDLYNSSTGRAYQCYYA